jgi:hypothetical protein
LVGGEGFAVDASLIVADANKQRSISGSEWNCWKGERKKPIVGHGGCGPARSSESDGFSTQFLRSTNPLRHTRQHSNPFVMNKTG